MTPEVAYLLAGAGLAAVLILGGQWCAEANRRRTSRARNADLRARFAQELAAGMSTPLGDALGVNGDDVTWARRATQLDEAVDRFNARITELGDVCSSAFVPPKTTTEET